MQNRWEEQDLRQMGQAAVEWAAAYSDTLRARPITRKTSAAETRALLEWTLPQDGCDFSDLMKVVDGAVAEYCRHNGHPRFFGYVASPGVAVAAAASLIAASININVTSWRSGMVASDMELLTVGWLAEMIGFPLGAAGMGLLTSGGSMANLSALAAARAVKGSGPVYAAEETHFSVKKAARLLAMGPVRLVPVNAGRQMDEDALVRMAREDRAAGMSPAVVVASAGTAGTGTIDRLDRIAAAARSEGLWMHVDGAYGALAAVADSARAQFSGMQEADSVSLDPHKWLYLPVGTGCVLYRDAGAARAAFGETAEYIRTVGLEQDEAFAYWDYGPELSRPFRALPLWMLIKSVGVRVLAEAIEENLACARHFAELIEARADVEMLAAGLSIFCFRYRPAGFDGDLDQLNERVMLRLQQGGSSYVSNAKVSGRFALRGCVLNYRTRREDMVRLLEDVVAAGRSVLEDLGAT
jgi:glutamate/tyrosine decarboxylase-like PLP-dependent enzyme